MGIISKGILGGFSGKVGTVVGGNWKGIDYIRSKGEGSKNANPTPGQRAQQIRFALSIRFLQTMGGFVALGFKNYAIKKTGLNAALSYTLKNAITGVFPDFSISFGNVLVSRGDLPNALAPNVVMAAGSMLNYSWQDNSGVGIAKATDKVMLLAYCPELGQAIYSTAGAGRSALTDSLNLAGFAGRQVHTYIGFMSDDQLDVATSIYTGQQQVS